MRNVIHAPRRFPTHQVPGNVGLRPTSFSVEPESIARPTRTLAGEGAQSASAPPSAAGVRALVD